MKKKTKTYLIKGKGTEAYHYEVNKLEPNHVKFTPTNDISDNNWNLNRCWPIELKDNRNLIYIKIGKKKIKLDFAELDELDTIIRLYRQTNKISWPLLALNLFEIKDQEELL